jgi:outer membrane lipoprotein carrier protein
LKTFIGTLSLLLSLWFGAADADTATQRLRAFFTDVHTLSADFDQVVLDPNHKQVQSAQGTLYLQRPGRFRWDYTTPYKQLLVGDGKKVWFYDTELEQVTVKNQDAALGGSPAMLLSGDRPLEESFKVTERGTQDGLDWVELSPKTKDTEFSRVRLGFRDSTLEAMELTDGFGQTTHLHFTHERRNPALKNDLFKFVPPEGVDVVGDQ